MKTPKEILMKMLRMPVTLVRKRPVRTPPKMQKMLAPSVRALSKRMETILLVSSVRALLKGM